MWVYLWAFVRYWLVKASMASLSVHLSPLEKLTQKKERRIDETEEKSIRTKELIIRQPNAVLFLSHFSSLLLAFSMSLFDFRFVVFFPPLLYACFMHCNGTATTSASLSYAFWLYSSFYIINNNNKKRLKLHTCNLGEWVCACLCVVYVLGSINSSSVLIFFSTFYELFWPCNNSFNSSLSLEWNKKQQQQEPISLCVALWTPS